MTEKIRLYKQGDKVICLRDCYPVQMKGQNIIQKGTIWVTQEDTGNDIYQYGHIKVNNWWYHEFDFLLFDLKDIPESKIEEALDLINI